MKKILIVDDEPMMLKIADRALKNHYETILAYSGEEALELFAQNLPDMVISDLKMPSMSGYELKKIIEARDGDSVPFIFLTSDETEKSEEEGRELGAADYIRKPVRAEVLLARVNNIFDNPGDNTFDADQEAFDDAAANSDSEMIKEQLTKIPDWIIKEPLIEEEEGIKNCGSAEAYLSSIEIFKKHIANNIQILENCYKSGDIDNYTIKAHGLKSTSRIIGCMTLSAKAKSMEDAGNEKNLSYIQKEHAAFIEECKRHQNLFLSHNQEDEKEAITDEEVEDALMAIREFAIEEDYGIVESIVEKLMKRALKPDALNKLTKIKTCLINLDWDEIRRIADEN